MIQSRTEFTLKTANMRLCYWFFIGAIALNSCDETNKNDFEKIASYPTSVGNEWKYNKKIILKAYESETSDEIIEIDTFNFYITVKVEKDTVLNETMDVKQFTSQTNGNNWKSKSYCFQDSEGLKTYAYSNAGGNDFPKKAGKISGPIDLLSFNFFGPLISEDYELIFYYSTPVFNIKYPLQPDSKWTYLSPSEQLNLQIEKEVSGNEIININNHSYSCYIISWIYSNNENYAGLKIMDWISKEGLIKRITFMDRIVQTDSEGNPINTSQMTETILLDELKLY